MKAQIVKQMVSEGAVAHAHGFSSPIHRLVIPERGNLTLTPHGNNLYVWKDEEVKKGEVVQEVDVSDELVEDAEKYLKLKNEINHRLRSAQDSHFHFLHQ